MTEKLTSIEGPMFSGKTLEMIRIADALTIGGHSVQIFKPVIDDRGEGTNQIRSRLFGEWEATPLEHPSHLLQKMSEGVDVVMIDEVQFMNQKRLDEETGDERFVVVDVVESLLERNIQVVIGGLPRDFRRQPFGPMADLLALAQDKIVLRAVCDQNLGNGRVCAQPATETQRFVDGEPSDWNDPIVLVGDKQEGYAARCIAHHVVRNKPTIVFDSQKLNE